MRKRDIKVGNYYQVKNDSVEGIGRVVRKTPSGDAVMEPLGLMGWQAKVVVSPRDVIERVEAEDPERDERATRRTKYIAEGATTIAETIEKVAGWLQDLSRLQMLGFELVEPVSDGYLHLEKEG